jgi:hypothetical protein
MIRAEKTTPNADAFRTLIVGGIIAIILLLAVDPAARYYDEHLRPRPWISAEVKVLPAREGKPFVEYSVDARTLVRATWKAWVENERGVRLCGGQGPGDYSPATESPKVWGWASWLGKDCFVPKRAFRLCVSYVAELNSRARAPFGPYCSDLFQVEPARPD